MIFFLKFKYYFTISRTCDETLVDEIKGPGFGVP